MAPDPIYPLIINNKDIIPFHIVPEAGPPEIGLRRYSGDRLFFNVALKITIIVKKKC